MESSRRIKCYLWHGYVPPEAVPVWFTDIFRFIRHTERYSPDAVASLFDSIMDGLLASTNGLNVVPLSGGWDSRLILAALRERTESLAAVTVGNPGQLDYDLGIKVAASAGVPHISLSLDSLTVDWDHLREVARFSPWTYLIDSLFNRYASREAIRQLGACRATIWSGFLGDPLTGSHYKPQFDDEEVALAHERFSSSQRRFPADLFQGVKPAFYPARPSEFNNLLYEREFLDLAVRQSGCIAPIVLGKDWDGWTADQGGTDSRISVMAPFAQAEWAAYWLNAPREYHRGQKLYRQMAKRRFPDLFSLPSKYTWGHKPRQRLRQKMTWLQHGARNRIQQQVPGMPIRSRSMDNYLDFQRAFRWRDDYITVIEQAIAILKQREATPWLDLERLWSEHYRGKRDHSRALQVLLGLAVNLEVNT